ncbi:MAG TPA: hypothetical protein VMQ45_02095 [Burkholderiaceae bacterium]|nr:hypothetical protein [Burkholderiaceae bacterium]
MKLRGRHPTRACAPVSRAGVVFPREQMVMDKITRIIENEETRSTEQQSDLSSDAADQITPLTPECFRLVGGGAGVILL